MGNLKFEFKPSIWACLALGICLWVFISLGNWQYKKAQHKIASQAQLDTGRQQSVVDLPEGLIDETQWRYRRVRFMGHFLPEYAFLYDNQMRDGVAGYEVITPVKLEGLQSYVLVNRGWIAADPDRRKRPKIVTTTQRQLFEGVVWFPSKKVFRLGGDERADLRAWPKVWEHVDINQFEQLSHLKIRPFVVRLAANSSLSEFDRNWPEPNERVVNHLGYAYQWYGFAAAAIGIFVYINLKRKKQ